MYKKALVGYLSFYYSQDLCWSAIMKQKFCKFVSFTGLIKQACIDVTDQIMIHIVCWNMHYRSLWDGRVRGERNRMFGLVAQVTLGLEDIKLQALPMFDCSVLASQNFICATFVVVTTNQNNAQRRHKRKCKSVWSCLVKACLFLQKHVVHPFIIWQFLLNTDFTIKQEQMMTINKQHLKQGFGDYKEGC